MKTSERRKSRTLNRDIHQCTQQRGAENEIPIHLCTTGLLCLAVLNEAGATVPPMNLLEVPVSVVAVATGGGRGRVEPEEPVPR